MNVLDIILSTEVITGIITVGSLAMIVRSILLFTNEAAGMSPRLMRIEADLTKFSDGMGERKQAVKDLNTVVVPLREREERLRNYFDRLRNMELEHDRAEHEAIEEEEDLKKKRVQRKKMGFDSE